MKKYEGYEQTFKGRNSFSKIDKSATFMRMKDDHMMNGQLKPAYNVQIGTENQFIVGYSIHQKTTDTSLMISHIEKLKKFLGGVLPQNIVTDAGYGSEENYDYLKKQNVKAYVKYNNYHFEKKRKFQKNKFRVENLVYDKKNDEFVCPANKRLKYGYSTNYKTANGYQTKRRVYQCENCIGCSFRSQCHRSKYDRKIWFSPTLNQMKNTAREMLDSQRGEELRKKRGVEVESVFGQIKHNASFNRFTLKGVDKVSLEWALVSIAHNIKKIALTA